MSSFLDAQENSIRVRNPANGQWEFWTPRQLLNFAHNPDTPTVSARTPMAPNGRNTEPLVIDRDWYMSEGPGRYFSPDQFKVVRDTLGKSAAELGLTPGGASVSLEQFATNKGTAQASDRTSLSHYNHAIGSDDYEEPSHI